ncbi:hypothetical protein SAMN05444166_6926 [Singulisphaera sp. GP187]|nr:hypothetical protein SAMN05444166_6926 [Singulisphaera sp. GP187]
MRRIDTILSLSLGLGITGGAIAQDDALPLLPPSPAPSQATATASSELSPVVESMPASGSAGRSVLAIPGLNKPTAPRRSSTPTPASAGPATASDFPPLVGPSEMPEIRRSASPVARPTPDDRGRSLVLESVPEGEAADLPSRSTTPLPRRAASKPVAPTSTPAPRRAPGLFGRMFPTPFAPPAGASRAGASDSIKVEPRTDPASDAALKRRIEHQIRQTFGDRLRDVEVRVVGREVTVRGRATRFWQRRGLQRSVESIPSLSGLRSTVEVD